MLEVPSNPTALQYKYSFLSVSQLEGEDGPMCAQLLQHFKPNLEHLVQDTTAGRGARPGTKRKAVSVIMFLCVLNGFDAELELRTRLTRPLYYMTRHIIQ